MGLKTYSREAALFSKRSLGKNVGFLSDESCTKRAESIGRDSDHRPANEFAALKHKSAFADSGGECNCSIPMRLRPDTVPGTCAGRFISKSRDFNRRVIPPSIFGLAITG